MKRVVAFLVGVVLGVGLAMLAGWVLFPMDRQEVTPASMRADYQAEYIRLVAITYSANGDLGTAEARLRALGGQPFTAPLVQVTEQWISEGRSHELIDPLVDLARALGVATPAMTAYYAAGAGG